MYISKYSYGVRFCRPILRVLQIVFNFIYLFFGFWSSSLYYKSNAVYISVFVQCVNMFVPIDNKRFRRFDLTTTFQQWSLISMTSVQPRIGPCQQEDAKYRRHQLSPFDFYYRCVSLLRSFECQTPVQYNQHKSNHWCTIINDRRPEYYKVSATKIEAALYMLLQLWMNVPWCGDILYSYTYSAV